MALPKILEMLNKQSPAPKSAPINRLKDMIRMVKTAKDPSGVMQEMINNNPQAKQIIEMAQQSGMSYKDLFYSLAQQQGVNPDDIINMLK